MPKYNTKDDRHPKDWQEKILEESQGPLRFSLTNDYMFKAICQTNTYALKGLLNGNRIINIEMQMVLQQDWIERSLVYLCRGISGQLETGRSCLKLLHGRNW